MKVIDPGHVYELANLDGNDVTLLVFVKREGPGYPGNVGTRQGTNLQEVFRACIDRLKYLDQQIPDFANSVAIAGLRTAICALERRAAERHGRPCPEFALEVETMPTCSECGHIGCAREVVTVE